MSGSIAPRPVRQLSCASSAEIARRRATSRDGGVVGLGLCALIAMRGHISLLPADVVIARAFGGTRILGAVAVIGRGRGECGCAECEGRCGKRD